MRKKLSNAILVRTWFTVLFVLPVHAPLEVAAAEKKWLAHSSAAVYAGDGHEVYQGSLFSPILQASDSLLFVNITGQYAASDSSGAGIGIGYRHLFNDWIIGGWGFFDRTETANNNDLSRFNFGAEALTEDWDFRFNAYVPASDTGRLPERDYVELTRSSIAVRLGEEKTLAGTDFELGYRLPLLQETRFYAGGYYFDGDAVQALKGSQLRLETQFHDIQLLGPGSRLTLGIERDDNSSRDAETFGFLRARIPLGKQSKRAAPGLLEQRMSDRVVRATAVRVHEGYSNPVQAYNPITGRAINDVVFLDSADNNNLHQIVAATASDSYLIIDGQVENTETIAAREGQAFIGAGQPISVSYFDPDGGSRQLQVTPEGLRGTIVGNNAANDVISVPANATAANVFLNLEVTGGLDGISDPDTGANSSSIYARDVTIHSVAGRGIDLDDIGTLVLHQVDISNTGTDGIAVGSENNIQIIDSTIDTTGQESLQLGNRNHLLVRNSLFSNSTGQEAIQTGHDNYVELTGLAINNPGGDGIRFQDRNHLLLNDVTITGASDGIQFDNANTASMTRLVIINASDDGIELAEDDNYITLSNSIIDGAGSEGLHLGAEGNTAIISDTLLSNTGSAGIRLEDFSTLEFTSGTIMNTGQQGVIAGPTASGSSNDITITGSLISGTANEGIAIGNSSSLTLDSVEIINVGLVSNQEAIQLLSGNTVSLTSVVIDGATNDGIRVTGTGAAGGNTLDFNNVSISNVLGDAIQIDANNVANFNDLSISGTGATGINLNSDANNLDLDNSTIDDIGTDGVLVNGDNNTLDGAGNQASNPIGGSYCNVVGAGTSGSISFDDVAGGGAATCP